MAELIRKSVVTMLLLVNLVPFSESLLIVKP